MHQDLSNEKADSSLKCDPLDFNEREWRVAAAQEELPIDRQWGSYAQAFARPVVGLIGDGIERFLPAIPEIGPLGRVLAHQPIGVLVGATLLRGCVGH